jgi:hypothetical protein
MPVALGSAAPGVTGADNPLGAVNVEELGVGSVEAKTLSTTGPRGNGADGGGPLSGSETKGSELQPSATTVAQIHVFGRGIERSVPLGGAVSSLASVPAHRPHHVRHPAQPPHQTARG